MREPKLLILSRGFPPLLGGSNILMNNLFASYKGNVEAAVGHAHRSHSDSNFTPPCNTYYLDISNNKFLLRYYEVIMRFFPFIVRNFMNMHIRRYKPEILMIPYPEVNFIIPCYQSAIKSGLPYYVYMHDLWEENFKKEHWKFKAAKKWERKIICGAKRVFCMTDVQMQHYQKKYNIKNVEILPHSIQPETLAFGHQTIVQATMQKKTILFVGTVSDLMNEDSLREFSKAIRLLPNDIDILFCSSASKERLDMCGIETNRIQLKFVSRAEAQQIQSTVHILLAPLSFKNGAMNEVRTVFSTKLLEYLISGRPILVFSPSDSFHSISARKGGWGYVVDEDSPEKLAEGILKMLNDERLCKSLVENAYKEALTRNSEIFANKLYEWVKEDTHK